MKPETKFSGYVCPNCETLVDRLELDQEFGKDRDYMTCQKCGEDFETASSQKVFTQEDIAVEVRKRVSYLQKRKDSAADNSVNDTIYEESMKELKSFAIDLGLDSYILRELGLVKCLSCGNRNNLERSTCKQCDNTLEGSKKEQVYAEGREK